MAKKAKSMETLTLRREGKFKAIMLGENHCGKDDEQEIKYVVTVECRAKGSLDSRDYLFEQFTIDEFFQRMQHRDHYMSCERMSIAVSKAIRKIILEENPKLKIMSIQVELSAKPYVASMTYLDVATK